MSKIMVKRLAFWLFLFGFSSILGLLICEIGTRFLGIMDASHHVNTVNPGAIDISFNSTGMRDREFSLEKDDDVFRILILGDSITYGISVEADQTYVKQLEQLLNSQGNTTRFEVMNTGVPGWNTSYQSSYLLSRGVEYQPDLVLIGFCLNDAEDNLPPEDFFLKGASGNTGENALPLNAEAWLNPLLEWRRSFGWMPKEPTFSDHVKTFLTNYSHLYRFIRWRNNLYSWEINTQDDYPNFLYKKGTDSWNQCRTALIDISQAMAVKNVPVALVLFPLFVKLKKLFRDDEYPWSDLHKKLGSTARATDMYVVDLLPHYIGLAPRDTSVDPYHPNPRGHRIAAKAIYSFLINAQLVPKNVAP